MLAFDQDHPWDQGWRQVRRNGKPVWGLWENPNTGEIWRSWRAYGKRAGHYPGVERARRMARTARAAETQFARQLRGVGRVIGNMVTTVFDPANPANPGWQAIEVMLDQYRVMLRPWAEQTVRRMLADVSRRDASSWHALGLEIGRALKQEVETAPVADKLQELYDYQVRKILELPDQAAEKLRKSREFSAQIVAEMQGPAEQAMVAGRRWEGLVKDVQAAGLHVQSSANTVARTETARAHATLQAVRAEHIGSDIFQWLTANDPEVRDLHYEIATTAAPTAKGRGVGRGLYRWDDPPLLDDDKPGLPGTIWNCRCYALPILPPIPS